MAQTPEYRGFWVYAWDTTLFSSSGITTVISDTRSANMNVVIPQMRRRGDALYNSQFEPRCTGLSASFDPLADIITKAHDITAGQRIEVHPWIVTYHVYKATTQYPLPPQPDHVVNLHPDWLLHDVNGATLIAGEYTLDPGHPEVQKHLFNVCMDIISNYDVDGLNFDYIRYSSDKEGYNPVTLERYRRLSGTTGTPSPTDPAWKQFRRDQITGFLRKVYLNAITIKPYIKISCDTITWGAGPTDDAAWYSSSSAWNAVMQDWRGWMEEGILDVNMPMAYFRASVPTHALWYTNWSNFAKNHRFSRHLAVGPGIYLNGIDGTIRQFRQTRLPATGGKSADGVLGYAFHATNTNGVSRAGFMAALTQASAYDPLSPALFSTKVSTPTATWKTAPTKGYLKGQVLAGATDADGAVVSVGGPVKRTQKCDATGFYGFVDLQPGDYSVSFTFPGHGSVTNTISVPAGRVETSNAILPPLVAPEVTRQPTNQTAEAGAPARFDAHATGSEPLRFQWTLDGTPISNATNSSYEIPAANSTNAGVYQLKVTNVVASALSSNAVLNITAPTIPEIHAVEILPDGSLSFSGTGSAGRYIVEWTLDMVQWFTLTNVFLGSSNFRILDNATSHPQRFYRVRREF